MGIPVKCPNPACGKQHNLREDLAGKTVKCNACQQVFRVPPPVAQSPSQSAVQDPLIGKQLAHYKIESSLGKGGMGKVYKAQNLRLTKTCAIKILPSEALSEDPTMADRFIREARSAAAVEHPNVLPVYNVAKVGENFFIEMQYVDGGTLFGLMRQKGRLDAREAARIIRDVAAALQAAHEKGIIHRDMKPTNVMLTWKGHVFVMDFGLAKVAQASTALTQQGYILGTPLYMSPEQATQQPVDHRSDIYSLGVMFYQILTGTPPYTADSPVALLLQHKEAPIPDITQVLPDCPPVIAAVIQKMMAKDPAERYQSCVEVLNDLNAFLASPTGAVAVTDSAVRGAAEIRRTTRMGAKKRSAAPMVAAVAVVAIAVVVGAAYFAKSRQKAAASREESVQAPVAQPLAPSVPAAPSPPPPSAQAPPAATPRSAGLPSEGVKAKAPPTTPPAPQPPPATTVKRRAEPSAVAVAPAPRPETPPVASTPPAAQSSAAEKATKEDLRYKFDQVVAEIGGLMGSRRYEEALSRCREAGKEATFKDFAGEVRVWEQNVQACRRVMEQARAQARGLVGQKYRVEIKTGTRGRMRVAGDVLKFEDDTLYIQIGSSEKKYGLDQLGPTEVVRLASEGEGKGPQERLDQAMLLFAEGAENEGWTVLREVQDRAKTDQALADAATATHKFLTDWSDLRKRQASERKAQELIKNVMAQYDGKRWDDAAKGIAQLREELKDTVAYRKAASALDSLSEKAKQEQQLAADEAKKFKFWKYLGAKISVPNEDGKIEDLPAGRVVDVQYSPDGTLLAVAHTFGVDLWDAHKSKVLRRLDGHTLQVECVDFSPDGSRLVTGGDDNQAIIWETATGNQLRRISAKSPVPCVAFSPDGHQVASASGRDVVLSNADTGEELRVLRGHSDEVNCAEFSSDGALVVSGSEDKTARIWDAKSGDEIGLLEGHTGEVRAASFAPDGRVLATGQYGGPIIVWDAKARKRTFQVEGKAGFPHSVGFSKDGSMLATIGGHGVMLWRSSGGTPVWKNETMRSPSAFAFSPEGKLVAVAQTYSEPSVRLLDGKTGKETRTLAEYSTTANSVDFSPVEPRLLLSSHGCGQGICVLHDVEKGVQRRSWPSFVSLSSEVGPKRNQPVFTPDGKYVAGFLSTGIALWDTGAGKNILRFAEGNDRVGCLAITVDGHRIAYPSDGKTTKICDMKTRRTLVEVKTNAWPLSLVFSPDGSLLASAPYRDRQVHLYDSKSGTEVRTLSLSGDPSCAAFSPDGRLIAGGGGAGGTLILWDLATGEAAHTLTHGRKVRCVAFTPDGRQLASGNEEGSIKLWDVKSGQNVCSLSEHRDNVLSLCFSSDGRLLASASSDGMIGVWKRGKQP